MLFVVWCVCVWLFDVLLVDGCCLIVAGCLLLCVFVCAVGVFVVC